MKTRIPLKPIYVKLKKAKKENLLTFGLLFTAGIILLIPGFTYLFNTFASTIPAGQTSDWLIARSVLSLLMMLPSLVLFSVGYLLLESHSMGWKLSLATCIGSILMFALNHSAISLALSIGLLSATATVLEIRNRKRIETFRKDSPIVIENVAILGMSICMMICLGVIVFLFGYTIARGAPYINFDFLTNINWNWAQAAMQLEEISTGSGGGILGYVIGSLLLMAFCEAIAIPFGLGAAIYLSEYGGRNKITEVVRFFVETLAGVPSVVIGLLVFLFLANGLGWGLTFQGAAIGLAIMILPFNIRVVEEAMRTVPDAFREASYALGATKWETAKKIVVYAAAPGIITGILLGAGAALGESAVVLVAFDMRVPSGFAGVHTLPALTSLFQSQTAGFPALPIFIYKAADYGLQFEVGQSKVVGLALYEKGWSVGFAAAAVLIAIYLSICVVALIIRNRLNKKITGK